MTTTTWDYARPPWLWSKRLAAFIFFIKKDLKVWVGSTCMPIFTLNRWVCLKLTSCQLIDYSLYADEFSDLLQQLIQYE